MKAKFRSSNLAWSPVLPTMKEERSGPYLFPPLQLTKDPLEALVHVVKLGGKKQTELRVSLKVCLQSQRDNVLLLLTTAVITCEGKCDDYIII